MWYFLRFPTVLFAQKVSFNYNTFRGKNQATFFIKISVKQR